MISSNKAHSEPLPDNCRFISSIAPTPLIPVKMDDDSPTIWCKLEFLNPSGSTKDRIARFMLEKQWRLGKLHRGDSVVEASSGSTSIALALACAQMGLKFIAVMPETVSNERVAIIKAYGGEIILVPRAEGVVGAINRAGLEAEARGAYFPRQFENPDNADAHRTGQEILSQIPGGVVDGIVSGHRHCGKLTNLRIVCKFTSPEERVSGVRQIRSDHTIDQHSLAGLPGHKSRRVEK